TRAGERRRVERRVRSIRPRGSTPAADAPWNRRPGAASRRPPPFGRTGGAYTGSTSRRSGQRGALGPAERRGTRFQTARRGVPGGIRPGPGSRGLRARRSRLSWSLRELLLPRREPIQSLERRQRVQVEPVELFEQRMRAGRVAEQRELGRVRTGGRSLMRYVVPRLEEREHLPRPLDD